MNHVAIVRDATDTTAIDGLRGPCVMTAQTVLAEDTIIGTAMDIKPGAGTAAPFANPFNGGKEEMLYVDEREGLRWIRHSNGLSNSPGSQVSRAG